MKKSTQTNKGRRRLISYLMTLAMLLTLIAGTFTALAADDSDIKVVWTAQGIDETITDADRTDSDKFTTVGPFSYVETNTAGTFRYSQTPPTGITVEDLLKFAGVDTTTLESNRIITFVAGDGMRTSFTWGQLAEARYTYEYPSGTANQTQLRAGSTPTLVPAIISFNQGGSAPRNFMGITYPSEQFRGVMNQTIATIEIGGLAGKWGNPYVFVESGSAETGNAALSSGSEVTAGMLLRITNDTHGQGGTLHKYFYTTDGSDPLVSGVPAVTGSGTAQAFNWNSNSPSVSANPSIVVPPDDGSGTFTIKAVTYGYGLTPSDVVTYTYNYPEPPVGDSSPGDPNLALTITGAVSEPGYFTIGGLAAYGTYTDTYGYRNSAGPQSPRTYTGIYLDDLLKNVMSLDADAESITLSPSDAYPPVTIMLDDSNGDIPGAYSTDKDGNRIMLSWYYNGTYTSLRLIVGPNDDEHVNASLWLQNVATITVNAAEGPGGGGDPEPPPGPVNQYISVGGATPDDYDFRIIGSVAQPGYFKLAGLKAHPGITVRNSVNYSWINASQSTDIDTFTGVHLEDLLVNIMGLSHSSVGSISVTASDDFTRPFNLDNTANGVFGTAIDGTKMMLAWNGTTSRTDRNIIDFTLPRLIVGQNAADHVNRGLWVSDVVTITVSATTVPGPAAPGTEDTPGGSAGDDAPDVVDTRTVVVETVVDEGKATSSVTEAEIMGAIEEALVAIGEAVAAGATHAVAEIKLDMTTSAQEDVTSAEIAIPASALGDLAESGAIILTIESDVATVTFDTDTLAGLADGVDPNAELILVVSAIDSSELNARQREVVGDNLILDLSLTLGGVAITEFGGNIAITVPYTPPANVAPEDYDLLTVYYMDASGNIQELPGAAYDPETGAITFQTSHFSVFFASEWINPFTDMQRDDWFYRAVRFVYSEGLMLGVGANSFAPERELTRAMLVTILYLLEGEPDVAATSAFSDVAAGQWYSNAVAWAFSNGIIEGYGNGQFGTDDSISREQLATMFYRYALHSGGGATGNGDLSMFPDGGLTSDWATDAISWAVSAGIINGMGDGTLAPQGTSTRAQAATLLMRILDIL